MGKRAIALLFLILLFPPNSFSLFPLCRGVIYHQRSQPAEHARNIYGRRRRENELTDPEKHGAGHGPASRKIFLLSFPGAPEIEAAVLYGLGQMGGVDLTLPGKVGNGPGHRRILS